MPQIDCNNGNTGSTHPFVDFYKATNIVQCIDFSTRKENILDLVLTADPLLLSNKMKIVPPKVCDHSLISFKMEISFERQSIRAALDFKNANKEEIDREICQIVPKKALSINPNASDLYKFCVCCLHELMFIYKPIEKVTLSGKRIPPHIFNLIMPKENFGRDSNELNKLRKIQ